MKIYTKTGDRGKTALNGGLRVDKDCVRIDAYGTVDELNSVIGVAISELKSEELIENLQIIQNRLFVVGSNLATPDPNSRVAAKLPKIEEIFATDLENLIDRYTGMLEPLRHFILPGGSKGAAALHLARTVCRRAERMVVKLAREEEINENIVIFLNRLSDFLFTAARYENKITGNKDVRWNV